MIKNNVTNRLQSATICTVRATNGRKSDNSVKPVEISVRSIMDSLKNGDFDVITNLQTMGISYSSQKNEYGFQYEFEHQGIEYSFFIANPLQSQDITVEEDSTQNLSAFNTAFNEMGLRNTSCDGIYCEQHNPNKSDGDYSEQRHYFWDEDNQKMVEIPNVYYVSSNGKEVNNFIENYYTASETTCPETEVVDTTVDESEETYSEIEIIDKTISEYEELLTNATDELYSIESPIPPNSADYHLADSDETDEEAYAQALKEYQNEMNNFDNKITELNYQMLGLQDKIDKLKYQKEEIEINKTASEINENFEKLENSSVQDKSVIQTAEKNYNLLMENLVSDNEKIYQLKTEINDLYSQLFGMQTPVPPSTNDFANADGSIDEKGYQEAINIYYNESEQYNIASMELNSQIEDLNNELMKNETDLEFAKQDLSIFNTDISNLVNMDSYSVSIENLEKELSADGQIDKANSIKQEYKEYNTKLLEVMREKAMLRKQMKETQLKISNLNIPTPPGTSDYLNDDGSTNEEQYNIAYEKYCVEYDNYDKQTIMYNTQMENLYSVYEKFEQEINDILANTEEIAVMG